MAQVVDVTVSKLSKKGEGIALYQERELFIPQVLVGEKLTVELGEPFAPGSSRCPGKVLEIIQPSKDRASLIPCPYYGSCGGCQLMHVSESAQLEIKRSDIKAAFEVVQSKLKQSPKGQDLELDKLKIEMVANDSYQEAVRFKSIRYFGYDNNQHLIQGFYASRSHEVVAIEHCCQEPRTFGVIATSLCATLNAMGAQLSSSTSEAAPWGVKAVQLRQGDTKHSIQVLLIVSGRMNDEDKSKLSLWAQEQHLSSFYVGYNHSAGNSLFCEQVELLAGSSLIEKHMGNLSFKLGPQSFMQVNYPMTEKLYQAAIEHASSFNWAYESSWGLDLCCGVGTMTLSLSKHLTQVTGVEIVAAAIEAAKDNAKANGIENVSFIAGDMNQVLPSLIKGPQRAKVAGVIADPARAGLGNSCAALIGKLTGPCALSLIFCSLTALERDLPVILKAGFKLKSVHGFDMFPHSKHIETLVCLTKG